MRCFPLFAVLCALGAADAAAEEQTTPLYNVEIVDAEGVRTRVAGFHRASAQHLFRGFVGAASVEVPYALLRGIDVQAPARPGGRPRAKLTLRSGREVDATYDQREAEQLLQGFTSYGRVRIFFRDIRTLRFLGRTTRDDLPKFGPPARGVDARVRDVEGVEVEVLGLRRAASGNVLPGVRGAMRVDIPLRIVKKLTMRARGSRPDLAAKAVLRDGSVVDFRLPVYARESALRGEAEFGTYRIHLGQVRRMIVHRKTPALRPLDPQAAAEGRAVRDGEGDRDRDDDPGEGNGKDADNAGDGESGSGDPGS